MLPGTQVVAHAVRQQSIGRRHRKGIQPPVPVQRIHFSGMRRRKELSARIGPQVFRRAGHVGRTRSHQCDQFMLVDR